MMSLSVQETLTKYDIQHDQLHAWESALGIQIPMDKQGQKLYTRQHLNLFKNVKKHLALGRNLDQIKQIITLPPAESGQAIDRNIKSAWQHAPAIQSIPTSVPAIVSKLSVSLQSEALMAEFQQSAQNLVEQSHAPEQEIPMESFASLESDIQDMVDAQAPETDVVPEPTPIELAEPAEPVIETPDATAQDPIAHKPVAVSMPKPPKAVPPVTKQMIERISKEASPQAAHVASNIPLATVVHDAHPHSMQIVDRLLTEKDTLQQRLVEAEKLNSHLYNVNALFNKKVKELTELVQKMKANYNEADLMKLMEEKSTLQRQLLDAERHKLEAQRNAERAQNIATQSQEDQRHAVNELHAQRSGFKPNRFLGNWKETITLREIQYDTFGLNVEEQRQQHRLIDMTPSRIVGNVAFFTTRFAYPDNELWQRIETLTCVYLDDSQAAGDLQVDYILDGVPVCRAIYTATLERIS